MDKDNFKVILKEIGKYFSKKKNVATILIICLTLFTPFLVFYVLQVIQNTALPLVVVISPSMKPSLNEGDLLFVRGIDPVDIRNGTIADKDGDIIVYNAYGLWKGAPSIPIVHRVVDKWYNSSLKKWYFYAKGDANFHIDYASIPEDRIFGVVVGKIPYIGWVKIILIDFGLIYPIIITIIIIFLYDFIEDFKKKKEETKNKEDKIKNNQLTKKTNEESEF